MASNKFHAFWVNPYHMTRETAEFEADALESVLALVKKNATEDDNVRGLVVIWGERLEFEPATVVQTYRIK